MSTAIPPLVIFALVAAIALCGVGIWAAIELARTARSSRKLADDLDERVPPLADKLDVTVDAFNAELLRVDIIVDQLEGAVDRFTGTAETVREVVDAPIHLVSEVAERFRHGFRRRGGRRARHPQPPSDQPQAEVVLLDADADRNVDLGEDLDADLDADVADAERMGEFEDGPSVIATAPPETVAGLVAEAEPEAAEPEIEPEADERDAIIEIEPAAPQPPTLNETEPGGIEQSDSATSSTDEPEEA